MHKLGGPNRGGMKKTFLWSLACVLWIGAGNTLSSELPSVPHYSLQLQFFPKEERFEAQVQMLIENNTEKSYPEIPFLLYRLLDVHQISDEKGSPLDFTQTIVKFTDEKTLQVNSITIKLPDPLLPKTSRKITMTYGGSVYGYPEVMAYVRDRIDEQFSLIRPDPFSYPMLSLPSWESLSQAYRSKFSYDIEAKVPAGYSVACGGILEKIIDQKDSVTYVYSSKRPTWRIDLAVAKFKILKDGSHQLFIYCLPEDEQGGVYVLNAMQRVIEFYTKFFGEVKNYQGYTAIEIPDGWGSQAGDGYLLQAAATFKDTQRISEVYHEIAHTWNAKAKPEVQRCRFFDEAFASYFEALAIREFRGAEAFNEDLNQSREIFIRGAKKDRKNYEIPIAEYGKYEIGRNSYTKGAWALYLLHQVVGEKDFRKIIRTFLSEFAEKPADFHDFQKLAEKVSQKNLDKFFQEWIFGSESSRLLEENVSVIEMVERYQK